MARGKRQKIKESDWDVLFPGETFTIGTTSLIIEPLDIDSFNKIIKKVIAQQKRIANELKKENINMDNFDDFGNRLKISAILLDIVPDAVADAANMIVEDVRRLPVSKGVELVNKILDVNIGSLEDLEKNFKSLAEKFGKLIGTKQIQIQE